MTVKCIFCEKKFCKHKPETYLDGSCDFILYYKKNKYFVLVKNTNLTLYLVSTPDGRITTVCDFDVGQEITKTTVFKTIDNLIFT